MSYERGKGTHLTDHVFAIGEMGRTVVARVYIGAVEIIIVYETHGCCCCCCGGFVVVDERWLEVERLPDGNSRGSPGGVCW